MVLSSDVYKEKIAKLLEQYNDSAEELQLARHDLDLSTTEREKAKKDVKDFYELKQKLRASLRSEQRARAIGGNSSSRTRRKNPSSSTNRGVASSSTTTTINPSSSSNRGVASSSTTTTTINTSSSTNRDATSSTATNVSSSSRQYRRSTSNPTLPTHDNHMPVPFCQNCHRCQNSDETVYTLDFRNISSYDIKPNRSYCFVRKTTGRQRTVQYRLCRNCDNHLTHHENDIAHSSTYIFPSLIWFILTNELAHKQYGGLYLWSLVPRQWRKWWITNIKQHFPNVFSEVSLDNPTPIIKDITEQIKEWNKAIKLYKLPKLRAISNKYLLPLVLCPWGCTEFIHRCGCVSFEGILQRHLLLINLKLSKTDRFQNLASSRDDFLRSPTYDFYNCLIIHFDWRVMPSIAFVDGCPFFLTCKFHKEGCDRFMIHVPRTFHCLPSAMPDQLCQAVVQPNCLRPMRVAGFSNRYQMYQQRFSMKGVESINVTTGCNFGHSSALLWESEARSIHRRHDMLPHMNNLISQGKMSREHAECLRKYSEKSQSGIDYDELCVGGTYVPLETAMLMQREAKNRLVDVVDLDDIEIARFKRLWYTYLYPCQKMDKYGAQFINLPIFTQNNRAAPLWKLCAMLLCVEPLWHILATKSIIVEGSWYGFLLVYLSKLYIPYNKRRQRSNDPFKMSRPSVGYIMGKIPFPDSDYSSLFFKFSTIQCFDLTDQPQEDESIKNLFRDSVDYQDKDIIIISGIRGPEVTVYQDLTMGDEKFELVFLSNVYIVVDSNRQERWNSDVICRHGRNFSEWWHQKRDDEVFVQLRGNKPSLDKDDYTLVYVKFTSVNFEQHKIELLELLGGQSHVRCQNHRALMITSSRKKWKCSCNRSRNKEYLRCSVPSCPIGLCKGCFSECSEAEVTYINSVSIDPNPDPNNENEEDDDSSKSSESSNSYHYDFFQQNNITNHGDDSSSTSSFDRNNTDEGIGVFWADAPDVTTDEVGNRFMDGFEFELDSLNEDEIPTTDAGNEQLEVQVETAYGGINNEYTIGGSGLLIESTSLLTRKIYDVKGNNIDKYFVQRFCATAKGISVPILWPESTMFPGIFYSTAVDGYSMCGAIPAPLLNLSNSAEGFASVPDHIRTRLTVPFSSSSTNPAYIAFCYDLMANLSANFNDTRMFARHGLRAGDDSLGGLQQRGVNDSSLNNSVDSRQEVLNLCSSLMYFMWDFFLTFTCNQKLHFGTCVIRTWLDSGGWKNNYPNFYDLPPQQQAEIEKAIHQSAQGLLLRVWEEASALFIDLLKHSPNSPFFRTLALFARKEYQADKGNLSHIHAILKVEWEKLSEDEREFVKDLIRTSVCEIIRSDELDRLVEEGYISSHHDVYTVMEHAIKFLSHKCDSRCLVPDGKGGFYCRAGHKNLSCGTENSRDTFVDLPKKFSVTCIKRLIKCGLAEGITDESGQIVDFTSPHTYFNPKRHVPRGSLDIHDSIISPVETCMFCTCHSMQNIQRLYGCGEVCKYCCKYIGKIDEQNFMHIEVSKYGEVVRKAYFLHNTKITSSKYGQEKERQKDAKAASKYAFHGRIISVNEMVHHMLKYPDVFSDLVFVKISTTSLEFRVSSKLMLERTKRKRKKKKSNNDIEGEDGDRINEEEEEDGRGDRTNEEEDGRGDRTNEEENDPQNEMPFIVHHRELLFEDKPWRLLSDYQRLMLSDMKLHNKTRIDKVTQFSLRPPEITYICDMVGNYYRWFSVSDSCMKQSDVIDLLEEDIYGCAWIDLLQCQIKLRKKAFGEISDWIDSVQDELNVPYDMVELFRRIFYVYSVPYTDLSSEDKDFWDFASKNLIVDERADHLPIPVYDFIKPTMGPQFIHHLLLSLGRFETELDLVFHSSIRKCLAYARLIGNDVDPVSLEKYSDDLLNLFIQKQLCYYPNGQETIDCWIVHSGELFDSIIIRDEICISEMPSVLVSALFEEHQEEIDSYQSEIKINLLDAMFRELGDVATMCNIPPRDIILGATLDDPVLWDPIESFSKGQDQSEESYKEQKRAISLCVKQIDSYCDLMSAGTYTKNVIISGFPGGGKTFILMYVGVYAMCRGLCIISTAIMGHRAVQLGGVHWHKLLCIPIEDNLPINRKAEVAIHKLSRRPKRLELLRRLNIFLSDEKSQHSSELTQVIDIICRRCRMMNLLNGGILEVCTMDHSQLQPIQGRPFLTSPNVIPCYLKIDLTQSVRASNDPAFYRLQQITRLHYSLVTDEIVEEFKELCKGFTFVDSWDDPRITPSTFRVYAKQVPAKEAAKHFLATVRSTIPANYRRSRKSEDFEKRRQSRQDFGRASESTSTILESKCKEPRELIFFRGAVFQCTFNKENFFNQSQLALCYDLPHQDDLDNWRPVKVLLFPPSFKYDKFKFVEDRPKQEYLSLGFTEISMNVAPERVKYLTNDVQAYRKQYGLKHYVSGTIHSAMGDTYGSMASRTNEKFWDRGQLVVVCSRTRYQKDTIFVGNRDEIINSLASLLRKRTLWSDYMDNVLRIISVDEDEDEELEYESRIFDNASFPYRLSDISLPQAQTGYVFFMKSIADDTCIYIDTTNCIRSRLRKHNSGFDSTMYPPAEKRPFTILAYICGFDRKLELMNHVRDAWLASDMRDNDYKIWVKNGQKVIDSINRAPNQYPSESTKLSLVCLFR